MKSTFYGCVEKARLDEIHSQLIITLVTYYIEIFITPDIHFKDKVTIY